MKLAVVTVLSSLALSYSFAPSSFGSSRISLQLDAIRKPFISGNWKLNPQTKNEAVALATEIAATITPSSPKCDVALFVPYVFIEAAMNAVDGKLMVGAEVRFHMFISVSLY